MKREENHDRQWRHIALFGGIAMAIAVALTLFDIVFGMMSNPGGAIADRDALAFFALFETSPWLGLYGLDFLNVLVSLFVIVAYFGVVALHREKQAPFGIAVFALCLLGTSVFVSTNSALAMLTLAQKFANASTDAVRDAYVAAGEALIARAEHGSYGVFTGFFLSSLGSVALAVMMLKGGVFKASVSIFGIVGNALLLVYVFLVTFVPATKDVALLIAAPSGILALVWMVAMTIGLFRASRRA